MDEHKFKVGDRAREKADADLDLIGHWNEYWRNTAKYDGVFYVTGIILHGNGGQSVTYSAIPGGEGPQIETKYIEPAPITIRPGAFYKTRDGRKVGPMKPWTSGSADFQWESEGYLWKDDGENYDKYSEHTIVSEWTDEPAVPLYDPRTDAFSGTTGFTVPLDAPEFGGGARFKVGDRVHTDSSYSFDPAVGTITDIDGELYMVRPDVKDGAVYAYHESELRLVAEATSGKDDEPDANLLVTISADTGALDAEIDRVKKRLKKLAKRARKMGINLEYGELRDAA